MASLVADKAVVEAFKPVLKAIKAHASLLATKVDLVAVRPGFKNNDGKTPAIVLAFRPPQPAHADTVARDFAKKTEVAVWAIEASPQEQLRWLAAEQKPQRDPALERFFEGVEDPDAFPTMGTYTKPAGLKLDPVEAKMRVTVCASPDAGWPVLEAFLSKSVDKKMVIAMYHFTAPHIYKALRSTLLADPDCELHMVRHPELGEAGSGTKADDIEGETVVKRLRKALGDRFEFAKTTTGSAGIFGSAYHIKVAVADSKRFWLSSGNWQTTNQPPFDPINAPDKLPKSYQSKYNREYHAVIEHAGLAKTFEAYIEHDLASAQQAETPPFGLPDVAVPVDGEMPDDFAAAQYFEPLTVNRTVKVQPVLTPDNYADVVLKLIESAKESVWFQNQYIALLAKNNFQDFPPLVKALLKKQKDGLDVRVICRQGMAPKQIDALLALGFDPDMLKFQGACHNKTIIVDGKRALIGSHNWSNDGTISNRDASLLFDDKEIAEYFAKIYEYDWNRVGSKAKRRQPRVLRDGELPPAGTERVPFGDLFEDGAANNETSSTIKPATSKPAKPEKPPVPFVAKEDKGAVFVNGVTEDGSPATTISIKKLADALRRPATDPPILVKQAAAKVGLEHMGLPVGVKPDDLERAGWAIVFPDEMPAAKRAKLEKALEPLLQRREKQAKARYKKLVYIAGESPRDWLERHNVTSSDITPSRVPYHLMIVGSPKMIPFEFQYQIDLNYSVGRLWFDNDDGFENYAKSVVAYETAAKPPTKKEVVYFGPSRNGDDATQLSESSLVRPLIDGTSEDAAIAQELGFKVESLLGSAAKKKTLLEHLAKSPTLLFTASHGLQCANAAATQRERQGALVTGDWTGGPIGPDMLLTAADISDAAQIHGMVAFVFACYGAGTPAVDNFPKEIEGAADPTTIAPEPFIAALPQKLLGRKDGALAVIGHVERAWGFSIQPPKVDPQILPFRNAIGRILGGEPIGEATRDISERHATLSTELVALTAPSVPDDKKLDDFKLVLRWLEQTDARNYILLGDPATRVRTADM